MGRFGTLLRTALLVAATAFHTGCSGSGVGVGILTGSTPSSEKTPPTGVFIPDITGRPAEVAFISACSQAYGYAHDAAKVRAGYISYESKRGATPAQLAAIEQGYDSTYQAIAELGHRKANFCSAKDGEEVRAELRRFTSGFFDVKAPTAAPDWKKTKGDFDCPGRC